MWTAGKARLAGGVGAKVSLVKIKGMGVGAALPAMSLIEAVMVTCPWGTVPAKDKLISQVPEPPQVVWPDLVPPIKTVWLIAEHPPEMGKLAAVEAFT